MQQSFGHSLLSKFSLQTGLIQLNNGSFGNAPLCVLKAKQDFDQRAQENPDLFHFIEQEQILLDAKAQAAEFIGAPPDQTVWVQNATDAFNTVFKSFDLKPGDKLLHSNISYSSNKQVLRYHTSSQAKGLRCFRSSSLGKVYRPSSRSWISMSVTNPPRFEGTFLEHEDIKVVSLDHISSQPSILFPLKEIISVIRKLSPQTLIFIDGAHVFGGNLKLDLKDMDCDFYCTNLHKWGYTPRPCAILYIKQQHLKTIWPNIIANFADQGIQKAFYWQGTQEQINRMCAPAALQFINDLGQQNIIDYCHNLAKKGGLRVAEVWGTDLLVADDELFGNMVMVRSPVKDISKVHQVIQKMLCEHKVVVYETGFDGEVYVRFSAQIFNELSDFELAASLFLEVLKTVE